MGHRSGKYAWLLFLAGCQGVAGQAPVGSGGSGAGGRGIGGNGGIGGIGGNGGNGGTTPPDAGGRGGTAPPDAGAAGGAGPPPAAAGNDELYDPGRVPRFDLEVPAASIALLRAHEGTPQEGDYVRAGFRYGNEAVAEVGLRIKGETNRSPFEQKPAWKIKFDAFVPNQSFRGLRRMTFNNLGEDPSAIAERLAYDLFRAAGLPAPRANSAVVYVNGASYGIYANVETEDKTFLRRWFASADGNLYEEGQEDFLPGKETTFELETNEAANDRSDLTNLIASFAAARDASYLDDLGKALDVTHFLRFTAAEGIVNQWDMYGYTRFYPNNFRIYRDPGAGRFVFLPWGMDMAWKPYHDGTPHLPMLAIARDNNQARGSITAGAMFVRCLNLPACKTRYVGVVRELIQLLEASALDRTAQRYYDQVKPHVYADRRKAFGDEAFERAFTTVVRTIRERPARIRAELGP
jgi:hypothetical protein